MAQILTTPWWLQLIRGLLALAFGFYAVSQPALTLVVMVQFMGAFLFVEGVVLFFFALTNRTGHTKKSFVILRGLLYVLAGVAVLAMPVLATVVTAAMLGWFVGFLAIFGGVMEISSGLRAEKDHPSDLSLVFGILLLSAPMAYGVGLSFLFGVWSVVSGVFLVGNSLRIYTGKKRLDHLAHKAV
jgi:uncharacterized membrane protein HdeD (DUF308 family)